MRKLLIAAAVLPLLTGGCLSTVGSIVTAPVKVVSKGVDWTTTSQSEADRNYGKKMRKAEAREGRERKAHDKACREDPANCGPYTGFRAHPGEPEPVD
ncbi:hypothetical protein [Sphingomonas bacterium]|uniref:hypothetical protein n=1 Tax=Sphingomonas bacterium TaxID=1895847 RepID=UPI00261627D3|nr:hypothetical protein [Sphingomonas bacterium]MDB5677365.1 hypothetical protein [Sphingomonas bacterium]